MSEFTPSEVSKLRELLEIEEIRKVRLLYSHLMDSHRIDELADLFTPDGVCVFGPYGRWEGRETIRANFWDVEGGGHDTYRAIHNTCDHWVELTGPDSAVGRAYLIDVVTDRPPADHPLVVLGVYDEDYVKVDGAWKIAECRLQFIWPERNTSDGYPGPFPPTYQAVDSQQ
jgi:hypothetical protein